MHIDDEYKNELYKIYLAIFNLDPEKESIQRKCTIMTALMGGKKWSWRVVGITKDALQVYANQDFKQKSHSSIQRAHIKDRKDMYGELLSRKYEINEWWNYFWDNDKTIISTSSENNTNKFSEIYEIKQPDNWDDWLFRSSVVGFRFRPKVEGEFLRKLYNETQIQV